MQRYNLSVLRYLVSAFFLALVHVLLPSGTWAQRPPVRPTGGGIPDLGRPGNLGGGSGPGGGGDSLERRKVDTLNLVYYHLDSLIAKTLDSSISDFSNYFPADPQYIGLGNTGSPSKSLLFQPNMQPGWDAGFHALDLYRCHIKDVRFYNTNRPYTQLVYVLGPRAEQLIGITHTQNIKPHWNAAFDYKLVSAPGVFRNQRTHHNSYTFSNWYQSPNKRYDNKFIILFNKLQAGENGGIREDRDYLNDPVYERDRFTVPTKLGGAPRFGADFFSTTLYTGRQEKDFHLYLRQQYDFGRKDSVVTDSLVVPLFFPRLRFEHDVSFSRYTFRFQDFAVQDNKQTNFPDSIYYRSRYGLANVGDSLLFQDQWQVISNRFAIYQFPDEKNLQQFIKVGTELQLIKGTIKNNLSTYNQYLFGEYRNRTKNNKWDLAANGTVYLAGLNSGDYRAYLHLKRILGANAGSLKIGFQNINKSPSFLYRPESNFYLAANREFAKENVSHLFASWNESRTRIAFTADYYAIANYLYFNSFFQPRQEAALFNVLKLGASRHSKFGKHWNWYADVMLQRKAGNAALNLPLFYTRQRLAFEGLFFRNLNLSTGLDVRYYSPFRSDDYSPILGQFFFQDSLLISNRPDVAAFIHMRIKSFKAFVRAENLNTFNGSGGFLNHNFSAPAYPRPGFFLRIGLYWTFVN